MRWLPLLFLACAEVPTGEHDDGAAAWDSAVDASRSDSAAVEEGVAVEDARLEDAAVEDARPEDATAQDARLEDAAVEDPDAAVEDWGECVVQGVMGECIPVADCEAPRRSSAGFCPGPADIQCCAELPDAPEACDPEAHPQPNLGLEEAPGDAGCPPGMAAVEAFCVDRYEAALVDAEGVPWSPYHHPGARVVRALSLEGAVPQGYIDGDTASAACEAAGKRLCTDAEWLRACQGEEGRTFPYGEDRQAGTCNDARARHPAVELFPDDPNPFARIQHPCINQLPEGLARTGAHPGCVVPEGVYDLMGNLHEWSADPTGTFRGGFYVDTERNGPGCLYRTTAHNTLHWDYSTGFRCCAEPD